MVRGSCLCLEISAKKLDSNALISKVCGVVFDNINDFAIQSEELNVCCQMSHNSDDYVNSI